MEAQWADGKVSSVPCCSPAWLRVWRAPGGCWPGLSGLWPEEAVLFPGLSPCCLGSEARVSEQKRGHLCNSTFPEERELIHKHWTWLGRYAKSSIHEILPCRWPLESLKMWLCVKCLAGFRAHTTVRFSSIMLNTFAGTRKQGRVSPMAAFPSVSVDSC